MKVFLQVNRINKNSFLIYSDSEFFVNKIQKSDIFEQSENQSVENLKEHERVHLGKDELAIVLYTSGSTGVPKGELYSLLLEHCHSIKFPFQASASLTPLF